ncbi:hypothetical protein [Nannocystis sp. SCPEA4]|uniref:hypothetical protein n=1 Tax=Nannocystis sp. SCPEA4 TaxID=2996787 RepID=UPI0022705B43|nr:hypothetical protein [Nannocystis sp. SCPEA4]MCY1055407.1 hypothetical protein [Nannocystis sp. SCPEA4]
MLRSFAILALILFGCDLPDDTTTSSETDTATSSTSTSAPSSETEGMSSTSVPTTTTGDEPPETECHEVLGGFGFELPTEVVGQICQTCSGTEDCGCPTNPITGECVLDCEDDPCPSGLACLHLNWDGQDAWGCWPHGGGGDGAGSGSGAGAEAEPEPEPEPEPTCEPIVDLEGTVIGQVCQECVPIWDADGMVMGEDCSCLTEPLTGLCIQPCDMGCPEGQACQEVVIDQQVASVCWPAEA